MSNKTYDKLAIIQRIVIPALIACYATIGELLNIPYTTIVLGIAGALNLCFGTILKGLSNRYYDEIESEEEGEADE